MERWAVRWAVPDSLRLHRGSNPVSGLVTPKRPWNALCAGKLTYQMFHASAMTSSIFRTATRGACADPKTRPTATTTLLSRRQPRFQPLRPRGAALTASAGARAPTWPRRRWSRPWIFQCSLTLARPTAPVSWFCLTIVFKFCFNVLLML